VIIAKNPTRAVGAALALPPPTARVGRELRQSFAFYIARRIVAGWPSDSGHSCAIQGDCRAAPESARARTNQICTMESKPPEVSPTGRFPALLAACKMASEYQKPSSCFENFLGDFVT
jgi:hypothetical protein